MVDVIVAGSCLVLTAGLILPAIAKTRGDDDRVKCANNMRKMGIALHKHHDANRYFPSSGAVLDREGKGLDYCANSTFTWLLPYLEQKEIYDKFGSRDVPYNFKGKVKDKEVDNTKASKNVIEGFLCPSNSIRPKKGADSLGYGYCDYMPVAYSNLTDKDEKGKPTTQAVGELNKGIPLGTNTGFGNWPGALCANYANYIAASSKEIFQEELLEKTPISGDHLVLETLRQMNKTYAWANGSRGPNQGELTDGLAHTIAIVEDSGISEDSSSSSVDDPIEGVSNANGTIPARKVAGKNKYYRADWRWAEPAIAGGVSGPTNAKGKSNLIGAKGVRAINNFNDPVGGPDECKWTVENCGPNKEPFSFHKGGCNMLYMDGHVSFMKEAAPFGLLHTLLTPIEGVPPQDDKDWVE